MVLLHTRWPCWLCLLTVWLAVASGVASAAMPEDTSFAGASAEIVLREREVQPALKAGASATFPPEGLLRGGGCGGGGRRRLRHICHSLDCKKRIPICPRCAFKGSLGHCKQKMKRFDCAKPLGKKPPPPRSISDGAIGADDCPSLLALGRPGRFLIDVGKVKYAQSYDLEEGEEGQYDYDEYEPEFAAVGTPDELQDALRAGTNHIVITAHLDMTASTPEPDLNKLEALNSAIGRVSNTTLSIVGRCKGKAPASFGLTEPMPDRACAILVKEDFLDAPLGTTCLLLDSLYVAVASPASDESSVLVLHVDGLMWITNCVFQGAGENSRAIDANTINGGRPALYIGDTTFTTFTRSIGPGIRVLSNSQLSLNNVIFRDIHLIPHPTPNKPFPKGLDHPGFPDVSAVVAYENVLLTLVNVVVESSTVYGKPAADRAIGIFPKGTQVYSSPQIKVWQWFDGPATQSAAAPSLASSYIRQFVIPELEAIQKFQQQAADRSLNF